MAILITETFRRVVITVPTGERDKNLLQDDIKRLFSLASFKSDFKDVKTEIKPSVKPEVIIVDVNGEGADSVSRKIKDIAVKHKATAKIRNEKPMSGIKEGGEKNSLKIGDTLKHKLTGAEFKIDRVSPTEISGIFTKAGNWEGNTYGIVVGGRAKTVPGLIGKTYELKKDLKEGRAIPNIIGSVLDKLQDEIGQEEANLLWREKASDITGIINSVRGMAGTSTGQKVQAAVDKIKKLQMNESKKPKLNLKSMILEALEQVAKEGKSKEPKEEESEEETGDEKPKGKRLEKDEIGKFYIVTRPTKAEDNIIHETNILDLITKIKSGEIDATRVLGAFKKRGGANALAKVHLKQISAELDELKSHMEEFRNSKKTLESAKTKAKQTILKYKPQPEKSPEELEENKKKPISGTIKKTKIISKK